MSRTQACRRFLHLLIYNTGTLLLLTSCLQKMPTVLVITLVGILYRSCHKHSSWRGLHSLWMFSTTWAVKTCHFVFDYNSGISLSIFVLFYIDLFYVHCVCVLASLLCDRQRALDRVQTHAGHSIPEIYFGNL